MEDKYCPRCKQVKPLSDFGIDTSRNRPMSYCKTCRAEYGRSWRAADPERAKRIERESVAKRIAKLGDEGYKAKRREYRERYYSKHPEKSQRGIPTSEQRRARRKKERTESREKWLARVAVASAVHRGALPPASSLTCIKCGGQAAHYHHPDYKYSLYVVPVCIACHAQIHAAGGAQ